MSVPSEQASSCPAGPFCSRRWSRWCGVPWRDSSSAVSSLIGTGSSSVRFRPASPASRLAYCRIRMCLGLLDPDPVVRGRIPPPTSVADPHPYVLRPPGSGSGFRSSRTRYGSGSGSFYNQAKIIKKTSILLFCDFFMTFIFEKWCKCSFKK
jgi:hypothetical protein